MAKKKSSAEATVRNIRRQTRKQYNAEDKIRIVVEGLRGEQTIAELCRREGLSQSLYYSWSKEFLEAGKAAPGRKHEAGSRQQCKSKRCGKNWTSSSCWLQNSR